MSVPLSPERKRVIEKIASMSDYQFSCVETYISGLCAFDKRPKAPKRVRTKRARTKPSLRLVVNNQCAEVEKIGPA